jgi:phosphopentomutase
MMVDIQDAMDMTCEAIQEERIATSNMLYNMQGTVSQFGTSKECIAYNKALQEAAERVLALNK